MVTQHFIQQADVGVQGRFIVILLETGPAKFIECLLVKVGFCSSIEYGLISGFGFTELAADKQVFTAPELGFIVFVAFRVFVGITAQRLHGRLVFTGLFIGTRQLVERRIVSSMVRVALQ